MQLQVIDNRGVLTPKDECALLQRATDTLDALNAMLLREVQNIQVLSSRLDAISDALVKRNAEHLTLIRGKLS